MMRRKRLLIVLLMASSIAATAFMLRNPRGPLDVHVLTHQAPRPNGDGLVIDVQILDREASAIRLRDDGSFRHRPHAFSDRLLSNPLCGAFLRVAVRNASDRDLTLKGDYLGRGPRLSVGVDLKDEQGGVLLPPYASASLNSLAYSVPSTEPEPVVLAPGECVVHEFPLWDARGWWGSHLGGDEQPPTGLATARVVCDYTRIGDENPQRLTGPPILVRITSVDAKEWLAEQETLHGDPSIIHEILGYLFR